MLKVSGVPPRLKLTTKITDEQNELLSEPFSAGDVKATLFEMHPDKSPGPDVQYQVARDEKEIGPIIPGRGLRQGDLLSPYLFILCAEGLSALIRKHELAGLLHGVKVARGAPVVSHLFLADDCFMFFKANQSEACLIKHILAAYGQGSGQLWGNNCNGGGGIRWMRWKFLCEPKTHRGIGFKILHDFNVAMLGKQVWKLLLNLKSLVGQIFKAHYFPHTSIAEAGLGYNPSFVWRSLMAAKHVVVRGSRIQIGSGQNCSIGSAPWLPNANNGFISTSLPEQITTAPVSSLMAHGQRRWDYDVVADLFNTRDKSLIL
ncbi:reverse transcriptase domain-containing protein [Citrus sinensis]|uniref:Reverse transcriptase domain-containing protein n=1 Tax=Citrus sinensis TaxID=2711 RepID=A0ACB8IJ84_CITSI|nr:reverse transcriptase domain-containing protein [Citrus sinensis]